MPLSTFLVLSSLESHLVNPPTTNVQQAFTEGDTDIRLSISVANDASYTSVSLSPSLSDLAALTEQCILSDTGEASLSYIPVAGTQITIRMQTINA